MKITVRKIAEEAGVSPASVSRYINGSEDVSSEIASKVESALFSLGGSPVVRRPRKQIILILLTHLRFDFYGRTLAELLEISATAEDVASNQRQGRVKAMTRQEKAAEIARLEKAMKEAAKMLEFELAASLRDQIIELRGK